MITVINIYRRRDGSLTFRPGLSEGPEFVVFGVRRKPELRIPVSESSDVAYVRGQELSPDGVALCARCRRLGLRIWRERGQRSKPTIRPMQESSRD